MLARVVLFALALVAAASLAAAGVFSDAADRLDGAWQSDDFVLRIDAKRAQASVDPVRPFEWRHFLIKEVTAREIVFTIGGELFQASIDEDFLTLTSTSFRGSRLLSRGNADDLRESTSD